MMNNLVQIDVISYIHLSMFHYVCNDVMNEIEMISAVIFLFWWYLYKETLIKTNCYMLHVVIMQWQNHIIHQLNSNTHTSMHIAYLIYVGKGKYDDIWLNKLWSYDSDSLCELEQQFWNHDIPLKWQILVGCYLICMTPWLHNPVWYISMLSFSNRESQMINVWGK